MCSLRLHATPRRHRRQAACPGDLSRACQHKWRQGDLAATVGAWRSLNSTPRLLTPQPLIAAFAPIGEVIATDAAARHFPINGGTTERCHDLAQLQPGPEGPGPAAIATELD
ncbi:ureidoglycolate lyase [Roseateles amylovorans]|uniref:ureidoglycolate lyase n=1 Tax=Roseateles amylovorans TaxID=2978473 RepID=UPI003F491552